MIYTMFAQLRNGIMPAALITSANINLVAHVTLRRVHCSPAAPVLGDKGYKCFEQLLFIKCLTLRLTCTETFKGKKKPPEPEECNLCTFCNTIHYVCRFYPKHSARVFRIYNLQYQNASLPTNTSEHIFLAVLLLC